ncbi:MAG: segregation ATPase FtsK/SpoIIIE, family, partial [Actinomycetota bacterium]
MTLVHHALMIVGPSGRRPVVASVRADTRVADLCDALGEAGQSVSRLGQRLDPHATLIDAGVRAGDTLHIGTEPALDLRQLGPEFRIVGGVGAGLRRRVDNRTLIVGRAADADITVLGDRVSRHHAEIRWDDDAFVVRDLGSRNGVWVDGSRTPPRLGVSVAPGTPVRVGDVVFTLIGAGNWNAPRDDAPSRHHTIGSFEPGHTRRSFVPYVVPSAGAVALAATASGASAPVALAATPAALVVGLLADRGFSVRAARKTAAARDAFIADESKGLRNAARAFGVAERVRLPDPALLAANAQRHAADLWATPASELELRIGLADVEAVAVEGSRDALEFVDARTAHLVPVGVAVADAPIIVAGPEPFLDDLFGWLVVQAAARVGPGQLDIVVVSDDPSRWTWTACLPQATSPMVLPASSRPSQLPPRRATRRLLVLDRVASPWSSDVADFVLSRVDRVTDSGRATLVTATSPFHVSVDGATGRATNVLADVVTTPDAALAVALDLAGAQGPIADELESHVLIDQLLPGIDDAEALVRNWRSTPSALEAVIGATSDDVVRIRLTGQNSHALIAGTTGAGKSRLLETLAFGLAAAHGPSRLNMFIIDFKGGNELAGLTRLPHCVGFVSDREPTDVDRAIAALTREVARRDDLFASAGATDFVDFRSRTATPMARLVVIADEFGQFRRDDERGSRVATLLRIAAQGRSKGVHLVLATQTPSTDVTTEIRQNVGVRVCLRVAEQSESVAVLGVADAAALPRVPGRALIATDDHLQTVQIATSRARRAHAHDEVRVRELFDVAAGTHVADESEGVELFDAILEAMNVAAAIRGERAQPLLPPPLPEHVARVDLNGARGAWTTNGLVFGQRDRPGALVSAPFAFDLVRDGALTIVGGARSGRSTALLALAEAAIDQADTHHPLVVHAVDWSNNELLALTNSATDAGVVRRGDVEHLRRLIAWLRGPGITGTTRLVLVDRLDALVREVREVDGGALAAELIDVISGGRTRGVYVAATVDVAGLVAGPLASLGGRRLVLSVDDPTMAAAIGIPRRTAPTVSGRGIS